MTYYFRFKSEPAYHCFHFGRVLSVRNYTEQKSITIEHSQLSFDYIQFKREMDEDFIEDRRDYEPVSDTEFIQNYLQVERSIRGHVQQHKDIFNIFQNQIQ